MGRGEGEGNLKWGEKKRTGRTRVGKKGREGGKSSHLVRREERCLARKIQLVRGGNTRDQGRKRKQGEGGDGEGKEGSSQDGERRGKE